MARQKRSRTLCITNLYVLCIEERPIPRHGPTATGAGSTTARRSRTRDADVLYMAFDACNIKRILNVCAGSSTKVSEHVDYEIRLPASSEMHKFCNTDYSSISSGFSATACVFNCHLKSSAEYSGKIIRRREEASTRPHFRKVPFVRDGSENGAFS